MTIDYNKLKVKVDLNKITSNYGMLNGITGNAIPVVKSDAYGHGLIPVANALSKIGAHTMAVGTVEEAVKLRRAPYSGRIISLLGPVEQEDYYTLQNESIIPFTFTFQQLEKLNDVGRKTGSKVKIALKFDTGMARLGFSRKDLPELIARLEKYENLSVELVCSHLAVADDPDQEDFVIEQAGIFKYIVDALRGAGLSFEASLANTAALLAYPDLRFDLQRPGISLYGGNPFTGTAWEHLGENVQQAMEVSTPVIQVHDLPRGKSISYGRTFTAQKDMRVAIIGVGYADAYSRGLSGRGSMLLHGCRVPIVGRVCMQMTAVDVTELENVAPGDAVYLLGGESENAITADELAGWWGTISYEVFCLLGLNPREYVN